MPAHKIKDKLTPYRVFSYILYMPTENSDWLDKVSPDQVRIHTGPCARQFRLKLSQLWDYLFWMEQQGLLGKVQKDKKRGSAVLTLRQPTNLDSEAIDA
jgi:hypothetical protein